MQPSRRDRLRVVLAQGDSHTRAACSRAMAEEGMGCEACGSGEELLRLAADADADAILLDPALPDMDGSEACRRLRTGRATRHIPIVILATRRSDGSLSSFDEHADDCLARPFHLLELRLRMRMAAEIGHILKAVRAARQELLTGLSAPGVGEGSPGVVSEEATAYRALSLVGQTLAGCRLVEKLGGGSRPHVYLGQHVLLELKVCVTLLPVALADWSPEELERFMRGARAAARIDHPNVVPVLNAGREGELYFVVRRFVEGQPLNRLLRAGRPMPEQEALQIVRQVALGLAAAHAANVLHRDVKPGNIIVTPSGEAKLIDFGLARPMGTGDISSSGEIIGTPHYMSPEQCDGDQLDARTDIYSLGATLYHMITGSLPFTVPPGAGLLELLRKQIYEEPRPVRELNPQVSQRAAQMVERMMAKNRQDRYSSVEALLAEIGTSDQPASWRVSHKE